jgi:putative acetyltransferase
MGVTVRPLRTEDIPAIYEIRMRREVLPYMLPLPSLRLEDFAARLRDPGPDMHYFVAVTDGEAVGYIGMRQFQGRARHAGEVFLAVHPERQGQGIGTALLRAVIDLADNWLMLERLQLAVLASNPRAQALYERLGFQVEGRKRGGTVSEGRYVDEVLMARLRPGGAIAQTERARAETAEGAHDVVD